eukprot:TRINITY_DN69792_c0_g1_i1.p2 TRINITY_DN69792_c0_g1~~TRINITY_DN69792_c0_g1_i1.p2  ORF type:complete len:283 (+),score=29.26 TRINITY_DN69792_c0_g1_i1:1100-1948(+)
MAGVGSTPASPLGASMSPSMSRSQFTRSAPFFQRGNMTPPSTPPHSYWDAQRKPQIEIERCGTPVSEVYVPQRENIGAGSRPGIDTSQGWSFHRTYQTMGLHRGFGSSGSPTSSPAGEIAWTKRFERKGSGTVHIISAAGATSPSNSSSRSMLNPLDYVRWEIKPAGRSTVQMDQPESSRYLAYSRSYGEAIPWRNADIGDGIHLTNVQDRFPTLTRCPDANWKKQSLTMKKSLLPDLRQAARDAPSQICGEMAYGVNRDPLEATLNSSDVAEETAPAADGN